MNVLLLSNRSGISYKVMRCAVAAGASVTILGDDRSLDLKASRYCSAFHASPCPIEIGHADALVDEINRIVGSTRIDCILPGDGASTLLLSTISTRLHGPCFPLPPRSVYDILDDKSAFASVCRQLQVPAPDSRLFEDQASLIEALGASNGMGWITKPIGGEGGYGFVKLGGVSPAEAMRRFDYRPVLLQEFIPGEDICISLFCRDGEVVSSVVYMHGDNSVYFTRDEGLERDATRIARHFKYSGVICFDARRRPDGKCFFIECNPRFWNNIDAAMITGANFVEIGLPTNETRVQRPSTRRDIELKNVTRLRQDLLQLRPVSMSDIRFLIYRAKDYSYLLRDR